MGRRKNKSDGLVGEISMSGFAGARQPKGLAENDRRRLQEEGHLTVLTEVTEADTDATPPVVDKAPLAAVKRSDEPSADEEPAAKTPQPPAKPRRKTTAKRRRAGRSNGDFVLPPRKGGKTGARSCHFRLPAEIEAKLVELAEAHECSKTHVVCAAIESTWTKFHRQRRRSGA